MSRTPLAVVLALTLTVTGAAVSAQGPPSPPPLPAPPQEAPPIPAEQSAENTREELRDLLRQLPPSVGEVLALDPSLLNQSDYLAAYPALVAFVARHPDVRRNPSYYFGERIFRERNPRELAVSVVRDVAGFVTALLAFVAFLSVLAWLIRQAIEYRRWSRVTRVQTEVHTKLLDRLTSNEDLMAYMQSPAGRRFLESAPIPLDIGAASTPVAAPVNRILWSVQIGIVLIMLGVGFWLVQRGLMAELAQVFSVVGTVAVAVGIGFVASAAASYLLSSRLGLMEPVRPPS